MAALGFVLGSYRGRTEHPGHLWTIPIMMLVWDWLHGAVFGLVYLSVVVATELAKSLIPRFRSHAMDRRRLGRLGRWYVITVAVMMINPYGPRTYGHFLDLAGGRHGAGTISELQPVWSSTGDSVPLVFLLVWALVVLVADRRGSDLVDWVIWAVFALGALRYDRLAAVSSLAIVPIIARHSTAILGDRRLRWRRAFAAALMVAGVAILLGVGVREKVLKRAGGTAPDGTYVLRSPTAFGFGANEAMVPAGAARFASALGLRGNMYNNANLGGYLAYALTPERPIFQYNMPPVFGDPTRFVDEPRSLEAWDINYAFAGSVGELTRLFPPSHWAWIYNDYVSTLVVRRTPEHADIIAKYEIRYFAPEQSSEQFEEMARCAATRPRLAFEMAVYLAYSRDARIAGRLRKLLDSDPSLASAPEMAEVLVVAMRRNPMIAKGFVSRQKSGLIPRATGLMLR